MEISDVKKIKELLLENKLTQQEIGDLFGVSRGTISNIARNKQYADVEPRLQAVRIPGGQQKHLNLETQNVALVGQIENLRQERNLLKRQLRAASKRVAVVDGIVEDLGPIIKPLKPAKPFRVDDKSIKTIDETMVLLLSDNHCDQIVRPQEVDGLEDHTFPISVRRHEVLVEEIIKWKERALINFNFKRLHVFGLGDYTSGSIHDHEKKSYYGCQFTNDLAIAQLFAQMFRELAAHFSEVVVDTVVGNHGRLTDKYEFDHQAVQNNHDTLIMKIVEIYCKDIPNISFRFPEGLSTVVNVEGHNFLLHHGHGKKGGAEVWNQARRKAGKVVPLHKGSLDYFCSGHYHSQGEAPASGGCRMIANGAMLACDPYSYQSLDEASSATQLLFGVHKNNGVTWRLPIQVRKSDEGTGPLRYEVLEKP